MTREELILQKAVFKFIDMVFEETTLENKDNFYGFYDKFGDCILGVNYPFDKSDIWYYWRMPFSHVIESLEIEDKEFKSILMSYVEKKYGIKIPQMI